MRIEDGSGSSFHAKVDHDNRLHTEAVSRPELNQACLIGQGFNFNTGDMTLTTANESAVGYFKYDGEQPFVITEILIILGATTGGSGEGVVKIYRNPTGGTIISNAVPIEISANRDFSSSIQPSGDLFKGAEGNTLTGGTIFAESSRTSFGTVIAFDAGPLIIRKGNSLGVSWQPPAGNTSQIVKVAATGFIETADYNGN